MRSECGRNEVGMGLTNFFFLLGFRSEWLGMTQNGKKSEFDFFAQNEVRICSDSYHSAWNAWGRVNYSDQSELGHLIEEQFR